MSALFEIMACRLFGAEPLFEPKLPYCQLDPKEYIQVIFYLKRKSFHSRKMSTAKMAVSMCLNCATSILVTNHPHPFRSGRWYIRGLMSHNGRHLGRNMTCQVGACWWNLLWHFCDTPFYTSDLWYDRRELKRGFPFQRWNMQGNVHYF